MCAVIDFSLCIWKEIFFSQMRVSLLRLHLGSINLFGDNLLL